MTKKQLEQWKQESIRQAYERFESEAMWQFAENPYIANMGRSYPSNVK